MTIWNFEKQLEPLEYTAVTPILEIDEQLVDHLRSRVMMRDDFLRCTFFATGDRCCPFELHFGRGRSRQRINFFVGAGAEVFSYEECSNLDTAHEIAGDVGRFLLSRVRGEEYATEEAIVRAKYVADRLVVDGVPVRLEYRGSGSIFGRRKLVVEYDPWLITEEFPVSIP